MVKLGNIESIHVSKFPDGHKHLETSNCHWGLHEVICSLRNFNDLFLLAQFKSVYPWVRKLVINYLFGARYDEKFKGENDSLDLRIICKFINRLGFETVEVLKPHSKVTLALLDNAREIDVTEDLIQDFIISGACKIDEVSILTPDVGASKWVSKLPIFNKRKWPMITCHKERDPVTGKIKEIEILGKPTRVCLIVDDLCDGGATYTEIADKLGKDYECYLIVTHAIFSKGIDVFEGKIKKIYCTDSFAKFQHNLVHQIEV